MVEIALRPRLVYAWTGYSNAPLTRFRVSLCVPTRIHRLRVVVSVTTIHSMPANTDSVRGRPPTIPNEVVGAIYSQIPIFAWMKSVQLLRIQHQRSQYRRQQQNQRHVWEMNAPHQPQLLRQLHSCQRLFNSRRHPSRHRLPLVALINRLVRIVRIRVAIAK